MHVLLTMSAVLFSGMWRVSILVVVVSDLVASDTVAVVIISLHKLRVKRSQSSNLISLFCSPIAIGRVV